MDLSSAGIYIYKAGAISPLNSARDRPALAAACSSVRVGSAPVAVVKPAVPSVSDRLMVLEVQELLLLVVAVTPCCSKVRRLKCKIRHF